MSVILTLLPTLGPGKMKVEIKGSLYHSNGKNYPSAGVYVNYDYLEYFGARTGIEWVGLDGGVNQFSVPLEALFYPLKYTGKFAPYFGGGLGYYLLTGGGVNESSLGYQVFTGFKLDLEKASAGFEIKYVVPDMGEGKGAWVYGGTVSGGMTFEF